MAVVERDGVSLNYLRRIEGKKKVKRLMRVYRERTYPHNSEFYTDDGLLAQSLLKNRVRCSRACCGNPRRLWGLKTIQELKADNVS